MLFRAINHGFADLARFEENVNSFDPGGLGIMQATENYKKIKAILLKNPDSFDPGI